MLWSGLSLLLGLALGFWAFAATLVAVFLAWAYSAPPLRLKMNGWWGNAAVGISYEGIAWFTGAAVMLGALPHPLILVLALLYSIGAHGIMTLNDFKSIEGDTKMGVRSLPVQLGPDRAARLACVVMALPQMAVILLLIGIGRPVHAGIVLALLGAQVWLMRPLLADPRGKAIWYSAFGVLLYVLGMLASALRLRPGLPDDRRGVPFQLAGHCPPWTRQTALGAIVILMTSTLNRVMVVELGLAAAIPGLLVGWHYAVQMSRPRWGYGADAGGRRAPWILGGMAVLAAGAILAALSAALMTTHFWAGFAASVLAYALIGGGVGAAGTNLLALLAIRTQPSRKAAAAAIVWIMMIMGFVLTAGIGGGFLKPFTFDRLILVTVCVCAIALGSLSSR